MPRGNTWGHGVKKRDNYENLIRDTAGTLHVEIAESIDLILDVSHEAVNSSNSAAGLIVGEMLL